MMQQVKRWTRVKRLWSGRLNTDNHMWRSAMLLARDVLKTLEKLCSSAWSVQNEQFVNHYSIPSLSGHCFGSRLFFFSFFHSFLMLACVCVCVCVCVCACVCVYMHMHVCVCLFMCTCVRASMHVCMRMHLHTHAYACMCKTSCRKHPIQAFDNH